MARYNLWLSVEPFFDEDGEDAGDYRDLSDTAQISQCSSLARLRATLQDLCLWPEETKHILEAARAFERDPGPWRCSE